MLALGKILREILTSPTKSAGKNFASLKAEATWRPSEKEEVALVNRIYVDDLGRVDQMWCWLESKCENFPVVY